MFVSNGGGICATPKLRYPNQKAIEDPFVRTWREEDRSLNEYEVGLHPTSNIT
jgi:hypothetical protein